MQRTYVYLLTLILVLGAAPYAAQAQEDPSQKKTGEEASRTAPVTYVYGNAASFTPEALARVRRRIARVVTQGASRRVVTQGASRRVVTQGASRRVVTQGASRRVVYPVIVILPLVQGTASQAPSPLPTLPPAPPGRQFTRPDLDRSEDDQARRLDARFDNLDDRPDALQDASRAREAAPSVVQVEEALLETKLFQTTDVIFAFDRRTLLPVSEKILNVVGDVLVRHPEVRLEVSGYTDSVGPEAYNQRLSEARALAVRSYLLDRFALAPERIEARGYGETRPVESNATATGRTLNRRVEFRVLNPDS